MQKFVVRFAAGPAFSSVLDGAADATKRGQVFLGKISDLEGVQ